MKRFHLFVAFSLLVLISIYALLHGKYRPRNVDDAWVLSYVQSYVKHGSSDDLVFGAPAPFGVRYFGKTHARVVGALLDVFGWTKSAAHLVSTVFLLLAVALWIATLRRLDFTLESALVFGVLMLLYEPFFSAANCGRAEAFVFFFVSLATFLLVAEHRFLSIVAAAIAFESHPVGAVSFVFLLAFALRSRAQFKLCLTPRALFAEIAGLSVGAAFYVALHHDSLATFGTVFSNSTDFKSSGLNNFLFDYFFETKFLRHLPELALFVVCAVLYFQLKLHKSSPLAGIACLVVVLFSFVIGRPNFHYAIYAYPAFIFLALVVADARRIVRWLWLGSFFLLVPQYGYIYAVNRDIDFARQSALIRAAVPTDGLPVVGGFNDWFAFLDRHFVSHQYMGDFSRLALDEFYLIEDDDFRRPDSPARRHFGDHEAVSTLTSFEANRETFVVRKMRRKR